MSVIIYELKAITQIKKEWFRILNSVMQMGGTILVRTSPSLLKIVKFFHGQLFDLILLT